MTLKKIKFQIPCSIRGGAFTSAKGKHIEKCQLLKNVTPPPQNISIYRTNNIIIDALLVYVD